MGCSEGEKPVPSNVEIKCRVKDPLRFCSIAETLSDSKQILRQEDTFFLSPQGRLKLRCFPNGTGELIYYERADQTDLKESHYWISRTPDPQGLLLLLSRALGVAGVVNKTRKLFLVGQTRIHLDEIEDLGTFAELEVVIRPEQSMEEGKSIAFRLMQELEISKTDLVDGSYLDLLNQKTHGASGSGEV